MQGVFLHVLGVIWFGINIIIYLIVAIIMQLLAGYVIQADKRHNGRLLLHYGFVMPGNPYDSVSIKVSHPCSQYYCM